MIKLFVLSLVLCLSLTIKVDIQTSLFQDETGRYRMYHGVNAVYKVFPFYPITDRFDYNNSLC